MSGDKLNGPKYGQDVLLTGDDRYTDTIATDVAIMEQGGVRTRAGEICDPAIDTRAAHLNQNPAELTAAIGRLVETTSATEGEER